MRDRKKKGIGLILIGIAIFAVPFFLRIREQNRTDQYLENFKEDEDESEETTGGKKKETILSGEGVIGIIEIPELDLKYPVFEGAGVTQLNEGNDARLGYACTRLVNSSDTILDICLDSGFDSQRTFNRVFKERYRITPSEYRKLKR